MKIERCVPERRLLSEPLTVPAVALRYMSHVHECWYVRELPGQGGADYGYVTDASKAVPMSPYWQRRFRTYVGRCSEHDSVSFRPVR